MTRDTQPVVLVTGAGSGIGRAITLSLARGGHRVYASMRDPERQYRALAQRIAHLGEKLEAIDEENGGALDVSAGCSY